MKSDFQIIILGSNNEFKFQGEYNILMIWYFIQDIVKPSTKFGASKLKEVIENKELRGFRDDVTKFNTWFINT